MPAAPPSSRFSHPHAAGAGRSCRPDPPLSTADLLIALANEGHGGSTSGWHPPRVYAAECASAPLRGAQVRLTEPHDAGSPYFARRLALRSCAACSIAIPALPAETSTAPVLGASESLRCHDSRRRRAPLRPGVVEQARFVAEAGARLRLLPRPARSCSRSPDPVRVWRRLRRHTPTSIPCPQR